MGWKFEIETDRERCLSAEMLEWWRSMPFGHVFNDPLLVKCWVDTFGASQYLELRWVVGTHADGNRSLWPMVLWRRNWKNAFLRVLMPAGGGDFDYHTPMFEKEVDLKEYYSDLISALGGLGGFDELRLEGVPDDSLPDDVSGFGQGEICPSLNLDEIGDEEGLMSFFKTSLRGDLRRQMRRLSEIGEVKLVEFSSWKDAEPEFEPFMAAHARRWPNAYKIPGFHMSLLSNEMLAGPVNFSALKVGDKTVAWHLGFEDSERFYYYMPAANPEFLKYSPVKVHLWQLVNRAIRKKLKVYDHLRGSELYKDGWSNGHHYVNTYVSRQSGIISQFKFNLLKLRYI